MASQTGRQLCMSLTSWKSMGRVKFTSLSRGEIQFSQDCLLDWPLFLVSLRIRALHLSPQTESRLCSAFEQTKRKFWLTDNTNKVHGKQLKISCPPPTPVKNVLSCPACSYCLKLQELFILYTLHT